MLCVRSRSSRTTKVESTRCKTTPLANNRTLGYSPLITSKRQCVQRNNAADRKIVVHQSDMSDEMKDYAIELAKKAIDMPGSESDSELLEIVTYIVLAFEKKFRGQW